MKTPTQQDSRGPPDTTNEKAQDNGADEAETGSQEHAQADAPEDQKQDKSMGSQNSSQQTKKKDGPEGGYDSIPVPSRPAGVIGYTLKITIHKASDVAIGDAEVMSSDPYVLAQINTNVRSRHKEDPPLRFRTSTVRKHTDPEFNAEWIVANVPSSGFKLKLRVYDEDPCDHDDLLGKVHIDIGSLSDSWPGIRSQTYKLTLRESSRRALLIRAAAKCLRMVERFHGDLTVSIEMLGRTHDQGQGTLSYTAGPLWWCQHYSPLLGHVANTKAPGGDNNELQLTPSGNHEKSVQRYNFQANELQLAGPVPSQLYHRFVEFKPWVGRLYTGKGLSGIVLGKALQHQHSRVYNFSRSTEWGQFPKEPCMEMTKKFLELVHYDKGGRIFTYVLTLDALWRFTETGKEFGIDMLSKHTMHSNVSIYIAFSGEFFIRRLKHKDRPPPPHPTEETSQSHPPAHEPNDEHPPHDLEQDSSGEESPSDPRHYELVIDNDSGTYRPNAKMLPVLADYLSKCLPGIHIMTLDCQADADKMAQMKDEQRELKKQEGDQVVYTQDDDSSSLSSSDDERLHDVEADYLQEDDTQARSSAKGKSYKRHSHLQRAGRDVKLHNKKKMSKMQGMHGGKTKE